MQSPCVYLVVKPLAWATQDPGRDRVRVSLRCAPGIGIGFIALGFCFLIGPFPSIHSKRQVYLIPPVECPLNLLLTALSDGPRTELGSPHSAGYGDGSDSGWFYRFMTDGVNP